MEVLLCYKEELCKESKAPKASDLDYITLHTFANSGFTQIHMKLSYSNVQTTQKRARHLSEH